MRKFLTFLVVMTISHTAFSQNNRKEKDTIQTFSYAYISISGKLFTKKLNVIVDLGDSPEQLIAGQEYSKMLTNKKSYASILNYMVDNEFELVETLTMEEWGSYQGSGGGNTSGIIFIMKKKK